MSHARWAIVCFAAVLTAGCADHVPQYSCYGVEYGVANPAGEGQIEFGAPRFLRLDTVPNTTTGSVVGRTVWTEHLPLGEGVVPAWAAPSRWRASEDSIHVWFATGYTGLEFTFAKGPGALRARVRSYTDFGDDWSGTATLHSVSCDTVQWMNADLAARHNQGVP